MEVFYSTMAATVCCKKDSVLDAGDGVWPHAHGDSGSPGHGECRHSRTGAQLSL